VDVISDKNIWSQNNETQDSNQYYEKFQHLKANKLKSKKKPTQIFIPNKNYDYSADTEEYGCTDELTTVTNKISSINIHHNNINQIDMMSKELLDRNGFRHNCFTEPDYIQHPYGGSFYSFQSNHTPTKKKTVGSDHLFPQIVNRASIVSQTTTNYSSNNKRTYVDTSLEHFESEEKYIVLIFSVYGDINMRIPTTESFESNNPMYNQFIDER
jgi:hypothetical protein